MKPNDLLVTPEQWEIISDILNRNFDVDEVFAFGSRVNGQSKKFSDLDLMIKDSNSFNLEKLALLSEEFSSSDYYIKLIWCFGKRYRMILEKSFRINLFYCFLINKFNPIIALVCFGLFI